LVVHQRTVNAGTVLFLLYFYVLIVLKCQSARPLYRRLYFVFPEDELHREAREYNYGRLARSFRQRSHSALGHEQTDHELSRHRLVMAPVYVPVPFVITTQIN